MVHRSVVLTRKYWTGLERLCHGETLKLIFPNVRSVVDDTDDDASDTANSYEADNDVDANADAINAAANNADANDANANDADANDANDANDSDANDGNH
jgi:hypothetical protein